MPSRLATARRRTRRARPLGEPLETRALLALVLSPEPVFGSYAGVGFEKNPVAVVLGTVNGKVDNDPSHYSARVDWGDGASDSNTTLTVNANRVLIKGTHTYTQLGTFTVTVTVNGPGGQTVSGQTTKVTVDALPDPASLPAVKPQSFAGAKAPGVVSLVLSPMSTIASYAGVGFEKNPLAEVFGTYNTQVDNTPGDYRAQVNWGDSPSWDSSTTLAVDANRVLIKGTHVYKEQGVYDVVVYVTGPDGQTVSGRTTKVVVSAMPDPASRPPAKPQSFAGAKAPGVVSLVLSPEPVLAANATVALAPSPLALVQGTYNTQLDVTPGDYRAQVNWGDGPGWDSQTALSVSGNRILIKGGHTYQEQGIYDVVVYVTGPDGQTVSGQPTKVVVGPPPPCTFNLVPALATILGTADTALQGQLATFVLPPDEDPTGLVAHVDWGDGTSADLTPQAVKAAGGPLQGSVTTYGIPLDKEYEIPGNYTIALKVEDDDGCSGSVKIPAKVQAAALPDLVPTQLSWNATALTADFAYKITGRPLPKATTVELEWVQVSGGSATVLRRPIHPVTTGTATGTFGVFHATAAELGVPPSGTTHLRVLVDVGDQVRESNENNNALLIPVPKAPANQPVDLKAGTLVWVPVASTTGNAAVVNLTIASTGYTGPVTVNLYQSDDAQFGTAGPGGDVLLQPSFQVVQVAYWVPTTVSLKITSPPDRGVLTFQRTPRFVLAVVDPANQVAETSETNNVSSVSVKEPAKLSAELEGKTPLANTRGERVELWLRAHRDAIRAVAKSAAIPPEAIAGAIAWEALNNVADVAVFGPGKVHWFSTTPSNPALPTAAEQVEQLKYLPVVDALKRRDLTLTDNGAIQYIGAIMAAYADAAKRVYGAAPADPKNDLRKRPEILASLYQGNAQGDPSWFPAGFAYVATGTKFSQVLPKNAYYYFLHKKQINQPFGTGTDPLKDMGKFVALNLSFLKRVVGGP